MLNQPQRGTTNYDAPLNQNFATLDDKMQYKATCTHDTAENVYVLTLLNIPATMITNDGADPAPVILPDSLPDAFTVVVRFPDDFTEGANIRIGTTDFVPKYANFEQGDTVAVSFYQPEHTCYFSSGRKAVEAADVDYVNEDNPEAVNVKLALDAALALAPRVDSLENLGHHAGTFDTRALLPGNASDFPNGITVNDFANIRRDETRGGATTQYIADAIAADGTITWTYNIEIIVDATGGLDAGATVAQKIADRVYAGVDLAAQFAAEIAAAPYNGNVWAWIQARAKAANFDGIHAGDYIPFTAGGNNIKAEIAGMDTYYNYGSSPIPHHIDFISRDCWPETHKWNQKNYNNGTTVSPHPWLASDLYAFLNSLAMQVPNDTVANPALVAVDYTASGIYDKLPAELKAVIVSKHLYLPRRYTAGSLLTDDNSNAAVNIGNLWLPLEVEVYGREVWGSKNAYSDYGAQQYPIFANNMKRVKGNGDGGSRTYWWLLSALGGNSTYFAHVGSAGYAGISGATSADRVPVCFRIA